MLDYLDRDRHAKHTSGLRISGIAVLLLAIFICGAYLVRYGLPTLPKSNAVVIAPTAEPTALPTPTPRPGEYIINPSDLVMPNDGQFAATGTQLLYRSWLRQVPMPTLKAHIYNWALQHYSEYFQKYYLSCEAAVIRLTLAPLGIHLSEDQILADMPYHPDDPEKGMVIEDINGSTYNTDGTINWANYGAHAPVVAKMLRWYLA
ncbi:MAG: hypothetical protein ACYC6L_12155, partial [Anaerolineae bacterium]